MSGESRQGPSTHHSCFPRLGTGTIFLHGHITYMSTHLKKTRMRIKIHTRITAAAKPTASPTIWSVVRPLGPVEGDEDEGRGVVMEGRGVVMEGRGVVMEGRGVVMEGRGVVMQGVVVMGIVMEDEGGSAVKGG